MSFLKAISGEELNTLNIFFKTDNWVDFTKNNPKFVSNIDLTKAQAVTSFSSGFKANLILIYLPINNLNDSYVVISTTEADYKANNFINFVILFQKNISSTPFLENRKYVTGDLEIYGYNSTLHVHEFEKNGSIVSTSNWSSTSSFLNQSSEVVNSVLPSSNCVAQSYDNQVADCTGWCHIAFELDVTMVMHAAFATTAVLWCSTHNNSPWLAP
jgi:hypothetical protein